MCVDRRTIVLSDGIAEAALTAETRSPRLQHDRTAVEGSDRTAGTLLQIAIGLQPNVAAGMIHDIRVQQHSARRRQSDACWSGCTTGISDHQSTAVQHITDAD